MLKTIYRCDWKSALTRGDRSSAATFYRQNLQIIVIRTSITGRRAGLRPAFTENSSDVSLGLVVLLYSFANTYSCLIMHTYPKRFKLASTDMRENGTGASVQAYTRKIVVSHANDTHVSWLGVIDRSLRRRLKYRLVYIASSLRQVPAFSILGRDLDDRAGYNLYPVACATAFATPSTMYSVTRSQKPGRSGSSGWGQNAGGYCKVPEPEVDMDSLQDFSALTLGCGVWSRPTNRPATRDIT